MITFFLIKNNDILILKSIFHYINVYSIKLAYINISGMAGLFIWPSGGHYIGSGEGNVDILLLVVVLPATFNKCLVIVIIKRIVIDIIATDGSCGTIVFIFDYIVWDFMYSKISFIFIIKVMFSSKLMILYGLMAIQISIGPVQTLGCTNIFFLTKNIG